jgi:2-polyprenyl-3-methyl-5-hydroxy-6-metoxy-1,4-benzoquinol methylase
MRMTHVIEHLYNGDKVLKNILSKLKSNGFFLPSMYNTLNFYDDPTHVHVYSVKELKKFLKNQIA